MPVSVESIRGYLDAARDELGIKGETGLTQVLTHLASQVHPLVLGDIFRSRTQIRALAEKLLQRQVTNSEKMKAIVDFLCADSGSHDYTINRREAEALGLTIEKPSHEFYAKLKEFHASVSAELKLLERYSPDVALGTQPTATLKEIRGLVESTGGGCYGFVTESTLTRAQVITRRARSRL